MTGFSNNLHAISRVSILGFLLFIHALMVHSQTDEGSYPNDLQALKSILEKTPSYRTQIRGNKKDVYSALFDSLAQVESVGTDEIGKFRNLVRLFYPIMDNHLGFYQLPSNDRKVHFPRFQGNLDSLIRNLDEKPLHGIEGVYTYGEHLRIGIFQSGESSYTGVVLDSDSDVWETGEFIAFLDRHGPNMFRAVYFHPKFKNLIYFPIEKYLNYALANSVFYFSDCDCVFTKAGQVDNYVNLPKDREDFVFKSLQPGIKYLGIAHFSADRQKMIDSKAFLETVKDSIAGSTLILDLRNNQGGAQKVSKQYTHILKKHAKKSSIYVLINNGTMSQGEIFTLQLRGLRNVHILGQNSHGALAYGSNYGKRQKLPSGAFEVYATDMYGHGGRKLLPYENVGLAPDSSLSPSEDWIEQTIRLIGKKSSAK